MFDSSYSHPMSQYNAPGYFMRVSPTAVVVIDCQGELYSVLVKNTGSSKGYIFPNGGIEQQESSIQGAMREFGEETGLAHMLHLDHHISPIGSLYRISGERPRNEMESELLASRPQGQKFLFVKEHIYHLFYCPLDQLPTHMKGDGGIEDVRLVSLCERDNAMCDVVCQTDVIVMDLLCDFVEQIDSDNHEIIGELLTDYACDSMVSVLDSHGAILFGVHQPLMRES